MSMNSRGRVKTAKVNAWFLESEKIVVENKVEHHLQWLVDTLAPRAMKLYELSQLPGVRVFLRCLVWTDQDAARFVLAPRLSEGLARLGMPLEFEVVFYGDED